jgi:hypothetical protein
MPESGLFAPSGHSDAPKVTFCVNSQLFVQAARC